MSQAMDAVFIQLGWRGRFQLLQLFQVMFCNIAASLNMLAIVFIGKTNEYRCKEIENDTSHMIPHDAMNVTYGQCSVTWVNVTGKTMETSCPNGLQFAEPVDRSLMSEWGLVCGAEALTDVSQTLLLIGMMVGAILFTSLADRYGRKPFHIISCLGLLVTGVASAFVPSFTAFLPLRFFLGAFQQGMGLTNGILTMEIMPTRQRFGQSIAGGLVWSVGMVLLVFLAFLMQHYSWRYLQILIAASSIYSLFLYWTLEESLRWLAANGKVEQAEKVLRKAARQNKTNVEDVLHVFRTKVLKQQQQQQQTSGPGCPLKDGGGGGGGGAPELSAASYSVTPAEPSSEEDLPKYGLIDFVRHKHVFMCILINSFGWCVNALTYYGLSMTSVTLADDMYLGFFLSAIVEIPAMAVFALGERFGRKRTCDVFHVMAGLSLLASVALSLSQVAGVLVIALSLLGKFAISASFSLIFLFTPEQFPTNLRNASLGVAAVASRIGAMIAPYSRTLSRHFPWAPGTVFGVLCLLLPICMRVLPETRGKELPQTIEQMEMYITAAPTPPAHAQKDCRKQADWV